MGIKNKRLKAAWDERYLLKVIADKMRPGFDRLLLVADTMRVSAPMACLSVREGELHDRCQSGATGRGEYLPYYEPYIRRVPDGDIVTIFERQIAETAAFFAPFSPEQARWRPAPKEWSVIEIVGHLADSERIFSYRALRIARNDPTPLPGADLEAYVPAADFESRSLADVVGDYVAVRHATVALLARPECGGLDAARDGGRECDQRARPRLYSRGSRDASCRGVAAIPRLVRHIPHQGLVDARKSR